MEKKSYILKISLLKKTLFTAKDIYEIYENIFHIYIYIYIYIYIFLCRKCLSYKQKIFLKYMFIQQKKFFDHKKYIY